MTAEIQTSFSTPGGTVLPLMNLKGKPYMQVAHRLVWFREAHPDWSIITEPLSFKNEPKRSKLNEKGENITYEPERFCVFKASVANEKGIIIGTGTKFQDKLGFGDFTEKAETGAIGRALATAGFGTQFATQDFDEEDRLADSPIDIPAKAPKAVDPLIRKPASVNKVQ